MNAEIIDRLQAHPEGVALTAMLDRLRGSGEELLETTRKQRDLLWNVVDRAEDVLNRMDALIETGSSQTEDVRAIQKSIEALRDLISTIKAYR